MRKEMQRTGSKWLTANICVYADRILAKPDLQPLREEVAAWAGQNVRVSYNVANTTRDFICFDLSLMTVSGGDSNKLNESQYLDHVCTIMPGFITGLVGEDYKGYTEVFIRVGNHLCARLG